MFGIFNMVTAVFVEHAIESANVKKMLITDAEKVMTAQTLRALILKLGGQQVEGSSDFTHLASVRDLPVKSLGHRSMMHRFTAMFGSSSNMISRSDENLGLPRMELGVELRMDGQITRDMFKRGLADPSVIALLEDLEVAVTDKTELFDVLDADASGEIDICEMVSALMKMRSSSSDKSDSVGTFLAVRATQDMLQSFRIEAFETVAQLAGAMPGHEGNAVVIPASTERLKRTRTELGRV
jgi:hypothetical protein